MLLINQALYLQRTNQPFLRSSMRRVYPKLCPALYPVQERFKVCERESKTKAFSKVGPATAP